MLSQSRDTSECLVPRPLRRGPHAAVHRRARVAASATGPSTSGRHPTTRGRGRCCSSPTTTRWSSGSSRAPSPDRWPDPRVVDRGPSRGAQPNGWSGSTPSRATSSPHCGAVASTSCASSRPTTWPARSPRCAPASRPAPSRPRATPGTTPTSFAFTDQSRTRATGPRRGRPGRRHRHRHPSAPGARARPGGYLTRPALPGARRHSGRRPDRAAPGHAARRHRPALLYGYGAYEYTFEPDWDPAAALPARPRRRLRPRARPRRRRGRPAWWLDGRLQEAEHLHRPPRCRRRARTRARRRQPDRDPRALGRRPAPGRRLQPAARALAGRRGRGAVRRRRHHDVRRVDPAHRQRVGRVGRPATAREFDWMLAYSPYDNLPAAGSRPTCSSPAP